MAKTKKISKSFLIFLGASVLIWFLITLSKEYTTSLTFSVSYKNIPQDKLLQKEPINTIEAIVKSSGFNILRTRLKNLNIEFDANNLKQKTENKYFFLTNNQIKNINKQIKSGLEFEEILPDTIFLDLGSLTSKKVPIKTNFNFNYHIGYDIAEPVKIKPDSIRVSGPETQIKNISFLNLETLQLDDIKSDFNIDVKVIKPKNYSTVKIDSDYVSVSGKVEKFTEGSIEVPFKIINLPENLELTTLNKTVEIIFVVGLTKFNNIDENFFEVICDYQVSKENNLSYLIPKTTTKSNILKNFKVVPNKIDFLIQK